MFPSSYSQGEVQPVLVWTDDIWRRKNFFNFCDWPPNLEDTSVSVNYLFFSFFFPLVSWALKPPWVSFCFSLYSLAWFPSICSILTLAQWLALSVPLSLPRSMFPLFTFVSPILLTLPCPGFSFPREWTSLWINGFAVSLFCSTLGTYILANLADTTEISAV